MSRKKNAFPRVSVIIPAYNAEKNIRACLDALLNQTVHPTEIILVDDGSTDSTKSMAESYSLVKVLSQKNQGPARARNAGANAAKGDIILFLDSDCVPEKNWLEEMVKPFEDKKVAGVQGAYQTRQTSLVARFDQVDIEYRYEKMKRSPKLDWIGSYSAAYRKNIFLENGGFDENFPKASGEDAEFSYRLSEKGYLLVFAPHAIVLHTHPETIAKYLHTKYYRAYWRMRMYLKHPGKAVADSYTPLMLKFNVGFALSILGFSILSIFVEDSFLFVRVSAMAYLLTFFLSIPHVWKKGFVFVFMAFGLYFLRSLAFAAGTVRGFLDERVWS